MALWHERDISHSSVERMIGPDATVTLDFALARLTGLIDKLLVYPENMQRNLDRLGGLNNSQRVLLALTQEGVPREDAYRLVQRNAMKVWGGEGTTSSACSRPTRTSRETERQGTRGQVRPRLPSQARRYDLQAGLRRMIPKSCPKVGTGFRTRSCAMKKGTLDPVRDATAEYDFLILPGLGNSGVDHWQSYWSLAFRNASRVLQDEWDNPQLGPWLSRLDAAIAGGTRPAVLICHSLSCSLAAHWAARNDKGRVRRGLYRRAGRCGIRRSHAGVDAQFRADPARALSGALVGGREHRRPLRQLRARAILRRKLGRGFMQCRRTRPHQRGHEARLLAARPVDARPIAGARRHLKRAGRHASVMTVVT